MCRKTTEHREDNKSVDSGLTSWAASEDQLTDFIIDKDEQGVGEGAEPPVGPEKHTKRRDEKLIQGPEEPHVVGGAGGVDYRWPFLCALLT